MAPTGRDLAGRRLDSSPLIRGGGCREAGPGLADACQATARLRPDVCGWGDDGSKDHGGESPLALHARQMRCSPRHAAQKEPGRADASTCPGRANAQYTKLYSPSGVGERRSAPRPDSADPADDVAQALGPSERCVQPGTEADGRGGTVKPSPFA
jgi:hypothetical protein